MMLDGRSERKREGITVARGGDRMVMRRVRRAVRAIDAMWLVGMRFYRQILLYDHSDLRPKVHVFEL